MEIKSKLYVVEGEKHIIGDGKIELLEAIERCGSVNNAAKDFGSSYPHAWRYIHEIEETFNKKVVNTKTGGKRGGGSNLGFSI
ncbi:MAG: molybdenum-binding protein [Candidatus Altiarchaeales archaeon HGW-Altiarchaeales-2]|nr:MAG: molybdenum-binding protein [Candidatus Altiarchaeales archaeon HGW-Altiarchaeales-2]